jgi:hypothetical protein
MKRKHKRSPLDRNGMRCHAQRIYIFDGKREGGGVGRQSLRHTRETKQIQNLEKERERERQRDREGRKVEIP